MVDKIMHDNLPTVKEIIRRKVSDSGKKNNFLKLIKYVKESLKYFHLTNVGKSDNDFHSVEYGIHEVGGASKEAK